jgi:hypothetical protein
MNATSPESLLQQSAGIIGPLSQSSFPVSDGAGTSPNENRPGVSSANLSSVGGGRGRQNTSSVVKSPKAPSIVMLQARKIMSDAKKIKSTANHDELTSIRPLPSSPSMSETSSDVSSYADMETVTRVSNYIDTLQSKSEGVTQTRSGQGPPIRVPAVAKSSRTPLLADTMTRYKSTLANARNTIASASTGKKSTNRHCGDIELEKKSFSVDEIVSNCSAESSTENGAQGPVESFPILVPTRKDKVSESNVARCEPNGDRQSGEGATQTQSGIITPTGIAPPVLPAINDSHRTHVLGRTTQCTSAVANAKAANTAGKKRHENTKSGMHNGSMNGDFTSKDSTMNVEQSHMESSPIHVTTENAQVSESNGARSVQPDDTISTQVCIVPPLRHAVTDSSRTPVLVESTRVKSRLANAHNVKPASPAGKRSKQPRRDNIEWRKKWNIESVDETFPTKNSTLSGAQCPIESSPIPVSTNEGKVSESNVARSAQKGQTPPTRGPSVRHAATDSSRTPVADTTRLKPKLANVRNAKPAGPAGKKSERHRRDNTEWKKKWNLAPANETFPTKDSAINGEIFPVKLSPMMSGEGMTQTQSGLITPNSMAPLVLLDVTDSSRTPVLGETMQYTSTLKAENPANKSRHDNIESEKTKFVEAMDETLSNKDSTINVAQNHIESSPILLPTKEDNVSESNVARSAHRDQTPSTRGPSVRHADTESSRTPVVVESTRDKSKLVDVRNVKAASPAGKKIELPRGDSSALRIKLDVESADGAVPPPKVCTPNRAQCLTIGSHTIRKDVNYYAVLSQIQKAVRLDNVSMSLGKILADSARCQISMDAVTEMFKLEMLKARGHQESGNDSENSVGENIPGNTTQQDEAIPAPAKTASSIIIANEGSAISTQGHQDVMTNVSDKVAADMLELLHLCDEVNTLFRRNIAQRNNQVTDSSAVALSSSLATNMNGSGHSVAKEAQERSSHDEILREKRTNHMDSELVHEDSEDEFSFQGFTDAQLHHLGQQLRDADLLPQNCIDDAVEQSLGCARSATKNVEDIDAFFSRFSIQNNDEAVHKQCKETPQNKCEREEVLENECGIPEEQAHVDKNLNKNIAGSDPRRDPLVELPVGKNESIDQGDTAIHSPNHLGSWKSSRESSVVTALEEQWFLPREERLAGHSGYLNIDFYSLYEATAVKAEDEDIDKAPWEFRDVGQRFLHEKSLESRNWFGKIVNCSRACVHIK